LIDEQRGAVHPRHCHQVRLGLAQCMVRFLDRDLVLGDDRVQLGARALSVHLGGKHEGDRVGLDPLCVAQPSTGTLIDGSPGDSWHRDSFRPTGRIGDLIRSIG
jgi:hypothetical protein